MLSDINYYKLENMLLIMYRLRDMSINAAIGIDNHLLERATSQDYEFIDRLVKYLKNQIKKRNELDYLANGIGLNTLLFETLREEYPEMITTTDVVEKTKLFLEKLKSIHSLEKEKVEEVKGICLKLSKLASDSGF